MLVAMIVLAILNYFNTKNILLDSYRTKNEIISNQIYRVLQFQDVALEVVEENMEKRMEELSSKLINDLFLNTEEIESADLDEVRDKLGMDAELEDLYIINKQGIVVNTTYEKDLHLNFFSFGEQHKNMLLGIFRRGNYHGERIAQESSTKRPKKYSYQATKDKKYIVQIGMYSAKADEIIDFVKNNLQQIEENQESVLSVDLYLDPENPVSLNKNTRIQEKHIPYLKKAIETQESQTVEEEEDRRKLYYQYKFMGREKTSLYKGSVICIISDMTIEFLLLRSELYKSLLVFGSSMLIILLLFYRRINIITTPIRNLVDSVNNITKGNLKERAPVIGKNEVSELSQMFNKMLDQLSENYNDLKKAKERAEQADKLKSAFLANMSHEIRTPMNSIIGFSDLLVSQDYSTEEKKDFLKLINENAKSLLNLINDIIDIAKIESEQLKIFESECRINLVLNDLLLSYEQVKLTLGKPHLEIKMKTEIEDNDFQVIIDEQRFKQIITNLVSNALKFTKQGFIEFGLKLKDPFTLLFYVKDTGIGIPYKQQKIIFERFRQADDSHTREYGGTGLGLAITKNLVELLGGKIWVKSEKGEGSTFFFTLPLKATKKDDGSNEDLITNKSSIDWKGKRILIAEDEEVNFKLLEAILRETNAELIRVRDGKLAVDQIESDGEFNIILMDIKMPRMNGFEAAKIIKKLKPEIPIVAQTAYAMAGEKETILQSGFDEYVPKPIKPLELLNTISRHFNK